MAQTVPPDFNLYADKTDSVIAAAVASMIICLTFYSLRILSRFISGSRIIASDIWLFGGVIACVCISSIDLHVLKLGLGRQIAFVALEDPELRRVVTMLKFLMANNCIYAFGQVTVKISLLTLYMHLFTNQKLHRIMTYVSWFTIAWGLAFVGVAIGSCRPVYAFWEFSLQPTSYCINNHAWYLGMAVPNILSDILLLAIPVKEVWTLKLDKRSKVALSFIFLLGSFVCVISIVRVVALFDIDNANPTFTLIGIANWSSVEFAIAVMCASLPTLRPLLNWLRPNSMKQSTEERNVDTIGGGRRKFWSSKVDKFDRMHGMESLATDTYALRTVEASHFDKDDEETLKDGQIRVTNTFGTTSR